MTSPTTTTTTSGWNAIAGNLTNQFQEPEATKENQTVIRDEYFRNNYDVMTGLRIAGTLGGFFIIVLLTLLYKSKCKKSDSNESPVPMDLGLLGPVQTSRIINNNNNTRGHSTRPAVVSLLDSPPYMNQMNHKYFNSPALLLTAANSESSDEDLSISGLIVGGGGGGRGVVCPSADHMIRMSSETFGGGGGEGRVQVKNNVLSNKMDVNSTTMTLPSSSKSRMQWLQQNIDIHVILPTPTISPSTSEVFKSVRTIKDEEFILLDDFLSASASDLRYIDDTSSENIPTFDDQDNDSRRSVGSDSIFACFENDYGTEILSIKPPPPPITPPHHHRHHHYHHHHSNSTSKSRKNRARHDHQRSSMSGESEMSPPIAVGESKSKSSRDNTNSRTHTHNNSSCDDVSNEDDDKCELKIALTQAQIHHRDSYCGSELESVNDYLESARRRSSSTQTDFSDLRQCLNNSYIGSSGSNASSQSQSRHSPLPNPFPHLSPYFNFNVVQPTPNTSNLFPSPLVSSVCTTSMTSSILTPSTSLSPSTLMSTSAPTNTNNNNPILLRVNPITNFTQSRKRSFDALKKTYSLQCHESSQ